MFICSVEGYFHRLNGLNVLDSFQSFSLFYGVQQFMMEFFQNKHRLADNRLMLLTVGHADP
jgi:hypothetical protein